MTEKAKIAVIGTGWWTTQAHLPALKHNDRADVVLIDRSADAVNAAGDTYEIDARYTSLDDALTDHPDIAGALVAVPHAAHYEVAMDVLNHDLHMLLEKPMTLRAVHAKELVDLAESKSLEILMGYTFPYHEPMQQAKAWVDEGLLGEPEYITCSMTSMTVEFLRGKPAEYAGVMQYPVTGPAASTYSEPEVAGGGQAVLQITHSAAMMFYYTSGLRAETVSAFMNNLDAKVDVADAFAVRMNNGAVATIGSTGNAGKGDGGIVEVHLHGSKGRLLMDAISGLVYMRLHDGREERIEPTYPAYPGDVPTQRFIEMLLDGARNEFPGRDNGLYTVELLEAAYQSAATDGMPVKIASLYE